MKTKKLTENEIFEALINKQLEPYKKNINDVRNKKDWFIKYTATQKESDEWLKWGTDFIRKHTKNILLKSEENAKRAMGWVMLGWGLKVKEKKKQHV